MRTVIKHFILTAPVKFVLSIIEKFSIKAHNLKVMQFHLHLPMFMCTEV